MSQEEIKALVSSIGVAYTEFSAKNNEDFDKVMMKMVQCVKYFYLPRKRGFCVMWVIVRCVMCAVRCVMCVCDVVLVCVWMWSLPFVRCVCVVCVRFVCLKREKMTE